MLCNSFTLYYYGFMFISDLAIESNEGRDTTFKALTDCVLIFVTNG